MFSSFSNSIVPSTLKSGTAPFGNSPSREASTVRVPFWTEGSMRITLPAIIPLRVSIDTGWPSRISLA